MTVYRPTICITLAAYKVPNDAILEALDRGPNSFSAPLVAADDETATWETTPIAYMMSDFSAEDWMAIEWQALCDGVLPSRIAWGVGGIISEVDALAACTNQHLFVSPAAGLSEEGDWTPQKWTDGVMAGLGFKPRPAFVFPG